MSLERAALNCGRCYELAKKYTYTLFEGIYRDDAVFEVKNSAMKALEDVQKELRENYNNEEFYDLAGEAIKECYSCKFDEPLIKKIFDDFNSKKTKEKESFLSKP